MAGEEYAMDNTMNTMQTTMMGMFKTATDNWFAAMNEGLKTHDEMIGTFEKPIVEKDHLDFMGEFAGDAMFESMEFGRKSMIENDKFAIDRTRKSMKIAEDEMDRIFNIDKMPRNPQEWNAFVQSMYKEGFEIWRENIEDAGKIGRKQFEEAQTIGKKWLDRSRDELQATINMNEASKTTRKPAAAKA